MHTYKFIKEKNGLRTWQCESCGRRIVEGVGQPETVVREGDRNADHRAVTSGLSELWLEAIRGLDL